YHWKAKFLPRPCRPKDLSNCILGCSWSTRQKFCVFQGKTDVLVPFKLPERGFAWVLASRSSCSKLWSYTELYHNVSLMAKFIFSMGNENYRKLQLEAKTRDVTIQALIRTVVIPEWIKTHIRSEEHTSELQSRGHLVCRL